MFKRYNTNIILSNKTIALLLFISIAISISISLSIPQISINIENYWDKKAYSINGAKLMIEMTYPLEAFDKKIDELEENIEIRESETFNTTINANGKEVYGNLIVGEYCTNKNEAILSANLSEILKVTKGDNVYIEGEKYKIVKIEQLPAGVGKQAEEMGYIKVANFDSGEQEVYSRLLFIDQKDYLSIEEELKKIGKGFNYSTVEDVKKELIEKNNTNMLALNMLNTIGIVMTIISIFSSIVLLITKNKRDIAIMKIQSIHSKKIKRVFQNQFRIILYPATLLGTLISGVITKILLEKNEMDFYMTPDIFIKVLLGFAFLNIVYERYISLVCGTIYKIKPINILRGDYQRLNYKGLAIKGIIFTIVVLCVYAYYAGNSNLFAGSMIIFLLIIVFGTIAFLLIKAVTMIKTRNIIYRYTLNSIKERMYSTLIIVLSISFTILFLLAGFTLSNIIATSYENSLRTNLNYNYMLTTSDPQNVEKVLRQTEKTGFYTKLGIRYGTLFIHSEAQNKITLCGINRNQYYVKYNIIQGEDIFEGELKNVIISDELSKNEKIDIGDEIILKVGDTETAYTVKGIYNSEGMNESHILIDERQLNSEQQGFMYLAKITTDKVIENLKGVQIVDIYNIGNLLEESLQNVLKIFKSMCLICIILSFIFNINLVYIDMLEQNKDLVVMRAIGISKRQLQRHLFFKMFIIFILTIFLSVGNYVVVTYYAMNFMFDGRYLITLDILFIPCIITALMLGIIFLMPLNNIRKMNNFDHLHETT